MLRPHFLHAPTAPLHQGLSANMPPAGRSVLGPQQDEESPILNSCHTIVQRTGQRYDPTNCCASIRFSPFLIGNSNTRYRCLYYRSSRVHLCRNSAWVSRVDLDPCLLQFFRKENSHRIDHGLRGTIGQIKCHQDLRGGTADDP
jgi:hypothetical protein